MSVHPPLPPGAVSSAGPTAVDKSVCDPLPSPVRRVFYLSREGTGQEHEVSPPPNPRVLHVSVDGEATTTALQQPAEGLVLQPGTMAMISGVFVYAALLSAGYHNPTGQLSLHMSVLQAVLYLHATPGTCCHSHQLYLGHSVLQRLVQPDVRGSQAFGVWRLRGLGATPIAHGC